jgi:hypothetical protein
VLADAEADQQRRVDPRTGRLDGGASRSRPVGGYDGGVAA